MDVQLRLGSGASCSDAALLLVGIAALVTWTADKPTPVKVVPSPPGRDQEDAVRGGVGREAEARRGSRRENAQIKVSCFEADLGVGRGGGKQARCEEGEGGFG